MTTPHVYDQWKAAMDGGDFRQRMQLWRAHKTEIRAEAYRRARAAEASAGAAPAVNADSHVLDRWQAAAGADKRALYTQHKTEIRAEATRRQEGGAQ